LHAAEERPIVDPSPGQQAREAFAEGQLADPDPYLIVTDRILGSCGHPHYRRSPCGHWIR
jgi:hypothetical protein